MIFILPPSFQVLRDRIEGRGTDDSTEMAVRLQNARQEVAAAQHYDYLVVNDSLDRAHEELTAIITAERCRQERRLNGFLTLFFDTQ